MAAVGAKPIEERVAEALSSGLWKERTAPNGKKFYANVKTKKTVWNLAKELEAEDAPAAKPIPSGPSARDLREERLEKARQRQEEESQLNASIAALERQKIKLENEIAVLQGPVEAEAAAIEDLKAYLMDQKSSVDLVAKEVAARRRERQAELSAMQAKVQKMESAKESELAHQEAMKKRHAKLVNETQELRSDLLREQATAEALKQSTRASELKLGQATEELNRIQRQVDAKRDVLHGLEADVVVASKQRAEVEQKVNDLQKQVNELKARVEKRKQQSLASQELEKKRNGTADELDALADLMHKVHRRRQTLKELHHTADIHGKVVGYQTCATELKHLLLDAKRDKEQLERLNRMLENQTVAATQLLTEYKAQAIELKHELGQQTASEGSYASPRRR